MAIKADVAVLASITSMVIAVGVDPAQEISGGLFIVGLVSIATVKQAQAPLNRQKRMATCAPLSPNVGPGLHSGIAGHKK